MVNQNIGGLFGLLIGVIFAKEIIKQTEKIGEDLNLEQNLEGGKKICRK